VISSDNSTVYFNNDGQPLTIDTATDGVSYAKVDPGCCYGDDDLSLSSNQAAFAATGYFYDPSLNAEAYEGLNLREEMNLSYLYGEKLSPDGTLLFQPTTLGIDVLDARLGNLLDRIALPITLSSNYDALVSDGTDNVLLAITGANSDGIAIIDLRSVPAAPVLPYDADARAITERTVRETTSSANASNAPVQAGEHPQNKPARHTVQHVTPQKLLLK
jgi:hypothetical protein